MAADRLDLLEVLGGVQGGDGEVFVIANLRSRTDLRDAAAVMARPLDADATTWEARGRAGEALRIVCRVSLATDTARDVAVQFTIPAHRTLLGWVGAAHTLTLCHAEAWGEDAEPVLAVPLGSGVEAAMAEAVAVALGRATADDER